MNINRRQLIEFLKSNGYDYAEAIDFWDDLEAFLKDYALNEEEIKTCLIIKNEAAKQRIWENISKRIDSSGV